MRKYDLQNRLIVFCVMVTKELNKLPKNEIGNYLKGQLVRSATSPALNYAEACDAESRKDFIHKLKIVLKELRETLVGLQIIQRFNFPSKDTESLEEEGNELIAIFKKSSVTAKRNLGKI